MQDYNHALHNLWGKPVPAICPRFQTVKVGQPQGKHQSGGNEGVQNEVALVPLIPIALWDNVSALLVPLVPLAPLVHGTGPRSPPPRG